MAIMVRIAARPCRRRRRLLCSRRRRMPCHSPLFFSQRCRQMANPMPWNALPAAFQCIATHRPPSARRLPVLFESSLTPVVPGLMGWCAWESLCLLEKIRETTKGNISCVRFVGVPGARCAVLCFNSQRTRRCARNGAATISWRRAYLL